MSPRWPSLSISSCRMISITFLFAPVPKSDQWLAGLKPGAYTYLTDLKIGQYMDAATFLALRLPVAPLVALRLALPVRALAALGLVRALACLALPRGLLGAVRACLRHCRR